MQTSSERESSTIKIQRLSADSQNDGTKHCLCGIASFPARAVDSLEAAMKGVFCLSLLLLRSMFVQSWPWSDSF